MEIFVDIDLDTQGNAITKRDDIALIDADTMIFAACLHCEEQHELMSQDFYTESEWQEIIKDPGYFEPTNSIYKIDIEQAYLYSKEKLQTILDNTGCTEYELHFTIGRESFRYTTVSKDYKANRSADPTKRAPTGLRALKDYWVEHNPGIAFNHAKWEADDIVVCKKEKWPDKYLLVALDKDVLYSLPGEHFNYYSSVQWNKDMKFFTVTTDEALRHHYLQCLTGDAGDNVIGLKGIGLKKAEKLLYNCNTHASLWDAVLKAYTKIGVLKNGEPADELAAIINMRLVSMNQLVYNEDTKEWEVSLWKPKS